MSINKKTIINTEILPEDSFEELMRESAKDKEFLDRTTHCEEDFKFIDSEVYGEEETCY